MYTVRNYFNICGESSPSTAETGEVTKKVLGRMVTVVDTPGTYNTKNDKIQIQKEIRAAIENSKEDYDAIVIVVKMSDDVLHIGEDALGVIEVIQKLLGVQFWDNGILLFTYGDTYDIMVQQNKAMNPKYHDLIFEEQVRMNNLSMNPVAVEKYAKELDYAVVKFNNNENTTTAEQRRRMVQDLLDKISKLRSQGYGKNCLPAINFELQRRMGERTKKRILKFLFFLLFPLFFVNPLLFLIGCLIAFLLVCFRL